MDRPPPPPETPSPKRQQIERAAEALFLAQGYGAVSMDQIARTAGVSKATLYAHFESKERLFASIVAERKRESAVEEALFPDEVSDLPAVLQAIGQRLLRFLLQPPTLAIYRVAIAESGRFPELGRALYEGGPQRFCQRFAAWLDMLATRGMVATADPLVAAHQFTALLRADVFLRASLAVPPLPDDAEIDTTVAAAVETWLRAFAPPAR
ncbi:TetR/AcrR family transcriptional regulator [Rhodovastum atsumiense]|uniref:TetR/AcrR family transcriptional regulator n=1 Tax=Rhodovastum atsumiense TaxID=504468 RepID=A0A5M6IKR0_9PROT|nr:TetR/AcrR family transcriptional regulator [Rhodovastum atsumiense]KAA5608851.1 TetR/AcrR family transcriptional regulator [Rhodovastum atsumiense]CAH2599319.1 TetR/AcrR family transcriptional regulator [Rhodovastum atsumiense]